MTAGNLPIGMNEILLKMDFISQNIVYKNSFVTMNDETKMSIENQIAMSQHSELTLYMLLS